MSNALPTGNYPTIDIGANLTNSLFKHDLDEVISRAKQSNIQHIIVTGTSISESQKAAKLAAKYPGFLFSTAGIHPHDAKHFNEQSVATIRELAMNPHVVSLGETGLDFCRNFSTQEEQIAAFEKQLEVAIELKRPLFLHERDAHKKFWEMIRMYRDDLSCAVVHCFTGSREHAFRYLDLDLYIGITGWICDEQRGRHLQEFIADIPLNRLMIETDAPYLIPKIKPKPALKSSRRNEPFTLPYVVNTIAKHSPHSCEIIANTTTENAVQFFSLSDYACKKDKKSSASNGHPSS